MLLNRDLEKERVVSIVVPKGWAVVSSTRLAPSDLFANIDEVKIQIEDAPFERDEGALRLILPSHSFTAVKWVRR